MTERADVIVLGLGVGGEEVADTLAARGLNVVGIESNLLGGECPYYGCIPTKMMVRGDDLLAEGRRIPGVAGESSVTPDWGPVARRIRKEATDNWDDRVAVERFEKKGGRFVRGTGRLAGPGKVSVNGIVYEATRAIVIATGTSPAVPPIPGLREVPFWTNREAVKVERLPSTLAILGGGAIGLELGQVFARFGVTCCAEMASSFASTSMPTPSSGKGVPSPSTWTTGSRFVRTRCWWQPAGEPTSAISASRPSASIRPRGFSTPTTTSG